MSYDTLTFGRMRAVNVARCKKWHPGFPEDNAWSSADFSNAMCGEAGEAANIVKKLRRHECGLLGLSTDYNDLKDQLGKEVADIVTYADLLAAYYNLDTGFYVVSKFNEVSERHGFPERLP